MAAASPVSGYSQAGKMIYDNNINHGAFSKCAFGLTTKKTTIESTMKNNLNKYLPCVAVALWLAGSLLNARADIYFDGTNDLFTATAPQLDISSVVVTNDSSHLIFTINLVGNPNSPNWGNYDIAISNSPGGDTINNGTGAYISWSPGMNYWVDSKGWGGAKLYAFDTNALAWTNITGVIYALGADGHSLTLNIPTLGLTNGQTITFDAFTGGGASQGAVDDLANTNQASNWWNTPYLGTASETYTLQAAAQPITNEVNFVVNMEAPISDRDSGLVGFNTNTDSLYVVGLFNGNTTNTASQLFQIGPTLFSNTVTVVQLAGAGQPVNYRFTASSLGYENPVLHTNGYRTIMLANQNQSLDVPLAYWSDRHLSDPTDYVTLQVDMSMQQLYGYFNPASNQVTVSATFNGFNTTNTVMTAGSGANSNLYSLTTVWPHWPTNAYNLADYKFFITNLLIPARDNGYEDPISTSSGNRVLSLFSANQTNTFYYNDESPLFAITSIQPPNPDAAILRWNSYSTHGPTAIGGIYQIDSSANLTSGTWTSNAVVSSTAAISTFTVTNLTGLPQQYFKIELIGL